MDIHEDFVQSCMDRLKAAFDTISVLERDKDSVNRVRQETTRMVRVLKVLREYVGQCDGDYGEERSILPMARYNLLLQLIKLTLKNLLRFINHCKQLIYNLVCSGISMYHNLLRPEKTKMLVILYHM